MEKMKYTMDEETEKEIERFCNALESQLDGDFKYFLEDIKLDPKNAALFGDVKGKVIRSTYKGTILALTYMPQLKNVILSFKGRTEGIKPLIAAISKELGDMPPFCNYRYFSRYTTSKKGELTFEWLEKGIYERVLMLSSERPFADPATGIKDLKLINRKIDNYKDNDPRKGFPFTLKQ